MLRFLTGGESHGPCLTAIIEGLPAGLPLETENINYYLKKRQGGYGRGERMKIESDQVEITSGVRGGLTLGSPLTLVIKNRDWANWEEYMRAEPRGEDTKRTVKRPRPGHADLAGGIKYRQYDLRNILERASARETAARVAVGAVCLSLLSVLKIEAVSHVTRIGSAECGSVPTWEKIKEFAPLSPVYCADRQAEEQMIKEIETAREAGDTIGGIFEVRLRGVPVGLGSHVHWDRRLDGSLAQALMSIPAIKGVEVGAGFRAAFEPGSKIHDEIFYSPEKGYYRLTNSAGGIEGGISNGEDIVLRAVMKPIPTLKKPLQSVDIETKKSREASFERSDVCAVPAASVVGLAAAAFVVARCILEKFNSDHLEELREAVERYREYARRF